MGTNQSSPQAVESVEVHCEDRWQVYRRLQELEIPCWCHTYKPLKVEVNSPVAIAQLWSVVRQVSLSRRELASWLDRCWELCSTPSQHHSGSLE